MAIPSLAMIPSGYKDGKVYSVLPTNGDGDFTFSRGSNATRVNKDGLIETITGDTPRLDYSDSSCPSLLLEPQRTNLIPYSEDFSNAYFTKLDSSISSNNAISPDGSLNASKLVEGTSNGFHWMYSGGITVTNATIYNLSVFAKKGERNSIRISQKDGIAVIVNLEDKVFDTIGGSVLSSNITELINDWVRIEYSFQTTSTTDEVYIYAADNGNTNYQGDGTSGIYIWGAQLEQQSYATSYIPTNGAIATRLADICTDAGNEQVINSSEGVLYFEGSSLFDTPDSDRIIRIENSSDATNQYVDFRYDTTQNRVQMVVRSNGVNQTTNGVVIADTTVNNKFALKYKVNDIALWVNGVEEITVSSASVPTGLDDLSFNNFYGNVKDVRVYNTVLTDAELEELTTL